MPIDVNSTAALLGAFGVLDRPKSVLLNMFFPLEQTFDTEEVYFDKVQRARRLAPLVVPTVAGKADRSRGYKTGSYKPPYLKPKHIIEPGKAFKRRAGERLLGELTPQERFDRALLDNLLIEDDEITRMEEYMAAQLLLTGSLTLSSADHPAVIIDIDRPSSHTVTLTGSLRWGQTGVDPLQNLRSWAKITQADSGYHPSVVVLDPLAADAFLNSASVTKVMNTFRQTSGNVNLEGVSAFGGLGEEVKYIGSIAQFEVYQYQQLYADSTGTVQKFMPDNSVIMGHPIGAQGVRTYGAIRDFDANLQSLARFPKVWRENDPSAAFTMIQSAPLPLLGWSEATFAATVA